VLICNSAITLPLCLLLFRLACSDAKLIYGIPGAILSLNGILMDSVLIIMLLKVNEQVEGKTGILSWIRYQRSDKETNYVQQGSCSRHLISNSDPLFLHNYLAVPLFPCFLFSPTPT